MSSTVEFDATFNYKYDGTVTLDVNIPRQEVPMLCSAFETVMSERFGATFYYPRYPKDRTRCRYEWFINYNRDPYGIRISAYFDVGDKDVKQLPFLLSWGPRFQNRIGTQFQGVTTKRIIKEIESVWEDVNMIIQKEPKTIWSFLSHIDLPPARGIEHTVTSDLITVYPSVKHKKTETVLSAVAVHVPAHFRSQAQNLGLPIIDKFIALLSLLIAAPAERTRVRWPKSFKFENTFKGKNIPQERLYCMSSCAPAPKPHHELTDIAKIAANLLAHPAITSDKTLWSSINAYAAGQELRKKQPTLSSVAFIASLTAYSKTKKCEGNITCSKCGCLENFHHDLVGESKALIDMIKRILPMSLSSQQTTDLNNLVRGVYSKQRSAFVHDAKLRHAELDEKKEQLGRPGKTEIVSEELEFMEDLNSIEMITRQVLLNRLLPFDDKIQALLEPEAGFRVRHTAAWLGTTTLRARRAVGLKIQPDTE